MIVFTTESTENTEKQLITNVFLLSSVLAVYPEAGILSVVSNKIELKAYSTVKNAIA